MLQPFVDLAMKQETDLLLQKERDQPQGSHIEVEKRKKKENASNTPSDVDYMRSGIECNVLTAISVSDTFGRILCYSAATRDLFLYSSNGKLIANNKSGSDDIYNVIKLSKSGDYFLCGSQSGILRIKDAETFESRKKFAASLNSPITCVQLPNDESNVLVGTANGSVLVYSLPQKAFVNVRIGAL